LGVAIRSGSKEESPNACRQLDVHSLQIGLPVCRRLAAR
jgi:hypothetical protein